MGRKGELRDVDRIAKKYGMSKQQRQEFGDYLEVCKNAVDRGTKNDRGDFTWDELEEKAQEFQAEHDSRSSNDAGE